MALNSHIQGHLDRVVGAAGYTVSGDKATLPSTTVDHRRLQELLDVAGLVRHEIKLAAGVLTVQPKT